MMIDDTSPLLTHHLLTQCHNAGNPSKKYGPMSTTLHQTPSPSFYIKLATIRTVLSIVMAHKWHINQLDVKNAYLHDDLNEIIYVHQPPGFVNYRNPNHACLLRKALYGLKQAPRA